MFRGYVIEIAPTTYDDGVSTLNARCIRVTNGLDDQAIIVPEKGTLDLDIGDLLQQENTFLVWSGKRTQGNSIVAFTRFIPMFGKPYDPRPPALTKADVRKYS